MLIAEATTALPTVDLDACRLLGAVSWIDAAPPPSSLRRDPRTRVRCDARTRVAIERALASIAGTVVLDASIDPDDLLGLPIDRLVVRIGPDFTDAVEAIVRFRPLVGGLELAWSDAVSTTRSFETRRSLRRLAGECGLAIEDPTADAETVAALDAIGIDVVRPAGLGCDDLDPIAVVEAIVRPTRTDGWWPTVLCDDAGRALSLVASSPRSLRRTVMVGQASFESADGVHAPGLALDEPWRPLAIEIDALRTSLRMIVAPERRTSARPFRLATLGRRSPAITGSHEVDRLIGGHRDGPATLVDLARARRERPSLAG